MKFVILSYKMIPGYNVKGPILSPASYDVCKVLDWIRLGLDVREVMPDGSYRRLKADDPKLKELLDAKIEKGMKERREIQAAREERRRARMGIPTLVSNTKPLPVVEKPKPEKKVEPKKEELIVEEVKEEPIVEEFIEEPPVDLFIDELENPEE